MGFDPRSINNDDFHEVEIPDDPIPLPIGARLKTIFDLLEDSGRISVKIRTGLRTILDDIEAEIKALQQEEEIDIDERPFWNTHRLPASTGAAGHMDWRDWALYNRRALIELYVYVISKGTDDDGDPYRDVEERITHFFRQTQTDFLNQEAEHGKLLQARFSPNDYGSLSWKDWALRQREFLRNVDWAFIDFKTSKKNLFYQDEMNRTLSFLNEIASKISAFLNMTGTPFTSIEQENRTRDES